MAVQNPTTNFNWTLPVVGASVGTWGTLLNQILGDDGAGSLDSILQSSKAAGWVTSGAFHVDRIPSLDAAKIGSGTFVNARIAAGNVTQHQAALSIGWGQLTSVPSTFAPANHDINGSVHTGTLGVAKGGTGVGSLASGNLAVGAGTGAMTALAPSTAGGFVRSNGSAWVRSTIQAADVPNLSATKITADEFNIARIPTITSAKVATDVAKVTISSSAHSGTPAAGTIWARY
jgi:hypothetical protein